MADSAALVRAASNTAKMTSAAKRMWETRTKLRATLNNATSQDLAIRAQIDEVFLVLAHLGEALLPLGIFNKDYYPQSLGEVQASLDNCGHEFLPLAWAELDSDVQFVCTAGLAFCAVFSPMPVYRGFGACVLGDWDWACPDMHYLEEKARKKAVWTVYGVKQKTDPQPMRPVFLAFDQAIKMLQVKSLAFLEKKPLISGFAEHQPRYGTKLKKEVRNDLDLLEDWVKVLERRGHPVPTDSKLTSWGIPFATWNSPYSCQIFKTEKDCETIMLHQMDAGRLLHALICRGSSNLDDGQILLLMPRSPMESLMCWLEGLPGTSHKIVKWQDLDTERFESKISKALRKKIGHYPIPTQFAVRNSEAPKRPSMLTAASAPAVLELPNTVSPPPYSADKRSRPDVAELHEGEVRPVAELGASPVIELPDNTTPVLKGAKTLAAPETASSSGIKSLNTLRRKATPPNTALTVSDPNLETTSRDINKSTPAKSQPLSLQRGPADSSSNNAVELPAEVHPQSPEDRPLGQQQADTDTSQSDVTSSAEQPKTDTSDQYLELLNKVAKGEISPQELSKLLSAGSVGGSVVAGGENEVVAKEQGTESTKSSSLPYPTTPIERRARDEGEKPRAAPTAPYPVTPTEMGAEKDEKNKSDEIEVPASLKPGSST